MFKYLDYSKDEKVLKEIENIKEEKKKQYFSSYYFPDIISEDDWDVEFLTEKELEKENFSLFENEALINVTKEIKQIFFPNYKKDLFVALLLKMRFIDLDSVFDARMKFLLSEFKKIPMLEQEKIIKKALKS